MKTIKNNTLFILLLISIVDYAEGGRSQIGSPNKHNQQALEDIDTTEQLLLKTSPSKKISMSSKKTNRASVQSLNRGFRSTNLNTFLASHTINSYTLGYSNFSMQLPFNRQDSLDIYRDPTSSSHIFKTDNLLTYCSTKASDFFSGIDQAKTILELFNEPLTFKTINADQRLFEGVSNSGLYGGRKLFWAQYLKDILIIWSRFSEAINSI